MQWHARPVVQALLFIVATLGATGLLVAADLHDAQRKHCAPPCEARTAR